jgi:micrococcal nuclease
MTYYSFKSVMPYIKILLCIPIWLFSYHLHAQDSSIKIVRYIDGDTVLIDDHNQTFSLRIADIDAPEINQAYGKKSKRALMQICEHTQIHIQLIGHDKYHRKIGRLQCNQTWISEFMVKNGHAWFYQHYSKDKQLMLAEQNAHKHKIGLWESDSAIPPWEWRQKYKQ